VSSPWPPMPVHPSQEAIHQLVFITSPAAPASDDMVSVLSVLDDIRSDLQTQWMDIYSGSTVSGGSVAGSAFAVYTGSQQDLEGCMYVYQCMYVGFVLYVCVLWVL